MATYLYSRDSKDKVRVLIIQVVDLGQKYEIRRTTGLLNGKLVAQPVLEITQGKVTRTRKQQAELEFRSIVNKQRDKGYKSLQELFPVETEQVLVDPMDYDTIDAVLPKGKTYAGGLRKLMLAKDPKTAKKFNWDRDWMCSAKLDGIRAGVYLEDGKLKAITRNGKSLNAAFTRIFKSPKWESFFKKIGPDAMVDGEIYIHGRTLQYLSGAARLEDYDPYRHDNLEFWIFDYTSEEQTAEERCKVLDSLITHFNQDTDRVVVHKHIKLEGYSGAKMMHDHFVKDGFEGLIMRDCSRTYGFGTRDDRMVKLKEFQDEEFEIIGMSDGLRPEDMVFKCITDADVHFECKPMGTKEVKLQYIRDIDNIVGKYLTVKFFNWTEDGKPFLPVGKAIRDYE